MKRMLFVCLLCVASLTMQAQHVAIEVPAMDVKENRQEPQKRDKDRSAYQEEFKAQKVAYITQKVGFTAEEAEKFWPLYNELDSQIKAVHAKRGAAKSAMYKALNPRGSSEGRTLAGDHRDAAAPPTRKDKNPPMSVENALDTFMATFEEESRIRTEYHQKFLQVITAKQVVAFYFAEEQFSHKIFRDFVNKQVEKKKK